METQEDKKVSDFYIIPAVNPFLNINSYFFKALYKK